ncbi:hypothetical protein OAB02_05280 [Candidatus Pelagibacter sp.]|nr:hypothetical protein [Candidatus Pelagibacter sp.]
MFYKKKIFLFFIMLFVSNCTAINHTKIQTSQLLEDPFINKGFALIYNENHLKEKIISRKIDERSLIIFQKNLKKNTKVKITNIKNNRSIIATVGNNANYPSFNNSVLSIRIADEINLDKKEPYVEILEILENSVFVAKKAKTFEEEKKVATNVPVNNISISDLNSAIIKSSTKATNKFSYKIKIADFYFRDTALLLIDRINNETNVKDAKIEKIMENKYRVYLGPFYNINTLQKSFNDINILEFENIEIIK